jgi:hypothetical protein
MDELHREFLESNLKKYGITGINFASFNYLLSHIQPVEGNVTTVKKFSILSRNYRPWRLNLYSKLIEQGLLDKFTYSFYNIHPYEQTVFPVTTMIDDLKDLTSKSASPEVVDWLFKVPYTLDSTDNVYNKWANVTYQTVAEADFHIAIETHFDHFLSHNNGQYQRGYCPNFITEKTYKAMACNRPFMIFATPHFLDDLKNDTSLRDKYPKIYDMLRAHVIDISSTITPEQIALLDPEYPLTAGTRKLRRRRRKTRRKVWRGGH